MQGICQSSTKFSSDIVDCCNPDNRHGHYCIQVYCCACIQYRHKPYIVIVTIVESRDVMLSPPKSSQRSSDANPVHSVGRGSRFSLRNCERAWLYLSWPSLELSLLFEFFLELSSPFGSSIGCFFRDLPLSVCIVRLSSPRELFFVGLFLFGLCLFGLFLFGLCLGGLRL